MHPLFAKGHLAKSSLFKCKGAEKGLRSQFIEPQSGQILRMPHKVTLAFSVVSFLPVLGSEFWSFVGPL